MVRSQDTNDPRIDRDDLDDIATVRSRVPRIDCDDLDDFASARSHEPSDGVLRIDCDDLDDFASARSHEPSDGVLRIDCDDCAMQGTDCCADCLVTFLCSREAGEEVVVDVAEARALRILSEAGLLPASRHVRRTG
jgi:hypothetical protein